MEVSMKVKIELLLELANTMTSDANKTETILDADDYRNIQHVVDQLTWIIETC